MNHSGKTETPAPDLFKILDRNGKTVDAFEIPAENDGIAIYIDRPRPGQESQTEYLQRAARAFIGAFDMALDELKELAPRAAEQLSAEYFLDD